MKRQLASVVSLIGLGLLLGAPLGAQETASAPSADKGRQLLDRMVEALGGESFLQVRDVTRRGRVFSFDRGNLSSPGQRFVDYVKFHGKERTEFGKKRNIVYVNDNQQGWELDRQGVREQTPEQIERFQTSIKRDTDYVLRFRLQEESMAVYYLGREFADNRRVHIIELVDDSGEGIKYYIDTRTYLPLQVRYRERDPVAGSWIEVVEYLGKYVDIQGIKTPMHFTRERSGFRSMEAHLSKVSYNTGVADEFFTRAALERHWEKVK